MLKSLLLPMRRCRHTLACALFWLLANAAQAQVDISQWLQAAEQAQQQDDPVKTLQYYFKALQEIEDDSSATGKVQQDQVLERIGTLYLGEGLYQKSLEYLAPLLERVPNKTSVREKAGFAHFQLQNWDLAKEQYEQALRQHQQNQYLPGQLKALEKLNETAHQYGDYEAAIAYEKQVLQIVRQQGDSAAVATVLNNIGYDLKYQGKLNEAYLLFEQALQLRKEFGEQDREAKAQLLLNMAIIQQNMGKYEASLDLLRRATRILETIDSPEVLTQSTELLASVYFNAGDYYNARLYCDEALAMAKKQQQYITLADTYELSSLIHQEQEDFEMALEDYKKYLALRDSLTLAERLRQQRLLQDQLMFTQSAEQVKLLMAEKEVRELEARRNRLELEKQKNQLELQQSELARQAAEEEQAKQQYQLARKQLEAVQAARALDELRQEKQIQQAELDAQKAREARQKEELKFLEAEKKALQKEKELEQLEKERQQQAYQSAQRFYLGLAGFGLLILLLIIVFALYLKRKNSQLTRQRYEIAEANQELATLNEEMQTQKEALIISNDNLSKAYTQITDSVRYAQRIQHAIMVAPAKTLQHFDDGFIFFRPRDIVSGDFYWYSDTNPDRIVLTAVDCTGHGVPGAFMSLIGNDLLNGIVDIRGETRPEVILTQLSDYVRQTLQQEKTDNQDGMDMALITYDRKARIVEFAGAKNPLVYFQNGEICTIKGNRTPIGGKRFANASYQSHQISLKKGETTTFYIFSDGFQDQFGGPDNRKYMVKRFRELLSSIYHLPMSKQQQLLEEEFEAWCPNANDQIDDILIIGFQLKG